MGVRFPEAGTNRAGAAPESARAPPSNPRSMRGSILSLGIIAVSVALGVQPGRGQQATPSEPAREVATGEFTVRYFGVRGWESFEILRAEDGWRVECTLEPPRDDLQPSETTYHLTEGRRFVRAEHRETGPGGVRVTYTLEGGALVARGTDAAGRPLPPRSVAVDEAGIVSGPNYATDFFVLFPFDLDVGESRTVDAAVFGFRSWEPESLRLTTTRKKNRSVPGAGGKRVECIVYRSRLELDGSTTWATSYLDPRTGEVHRLTIDLTIGSAKIVRE